MMTRVSSEPCVGRCYSVVAAVLIALLLLPGCVKFRHALTVQPDGSGKVEITFGMADAMLAHQDDDGFALASMEELLAQEDRGFVAFSSPESWTEDGFTYQRIVGYFEDVNRLVIEGDEDAGGGEAVEPTTFEFDGDGTLRISRCLLQQVALEAKDAAGVEPAERMALSAMVGGLRIEESVRVPGQIREAGPFAVEGDTARAAIDEAALMDEQGAVLTTWRNAGGVTVRFKPRGWGKGEQAAWETELEAAKAAWAAMKAAGKVGP